MLTVLIPAFNEEESIAYTVTRVREALDAHGIAPSEILVIDDGSTDRTAEFAKVSGASILRNPHNIGYGASLKRGIIAAQHDAICLIDADLTYPEHEIPRLFAAYQSGFDMVVGARTGHHYSGSIFKGPLRRILRFTVEFAAGRRIPDANSGLRVFSRCAALEHLPHLCDTFSRIPITSPAPPRSPSHSRSPGASSSTSQSSTTSAMGSRRYDSCAIRSEH